MSERHARIDEEVDRLCACLPTWRQHLRHEAQFWPQLRALLSRIVEDADREDAARACRRVLRALAEEGVDPAAGGATAAWLRETAGER